MLLRDAGWDRCKVDDGGSYGANGGSTASLNVGTGVQHVQADSIDVGDGSSPRLRCLVQNHRRVHMGLPLAMQPGRLRLNLFSQSKHLLDMDNFVVEGGNHVGRKGEH
jgi:hypothetical protein